MSEPNLPPPMMPWDIGPSIYQHIRSHLQTDGSLARDAFELPDERKSDGTNVRFAPGAMDGIATHHLGAGDADEAQRTASTLCDRFREYAVAPTAANKLRLYRSFQEANVIGVVDPFLRAVMDRRDQLPAARAYGLARSLAADSPHRGPVKFAIALLGLFGRREDIELLQTLGRHDEFTLFCAVALGDHDDADQQLWDLARHARGWGRVHVIERLVHGGAAERIPALRDWLLRKGYRNDIMIEYLACPCATAGRLNDALGAESVDEPLLDAAADLLSALATTGGPAEGMASYADAAEAIGSFLRHVRARGNTLRQFNAVARLVKFLEPPSDDKPDASRSEPQPTNGLTPEVSRRLAALCREVLAQPHWRERVADGLQSEDNHHFYDATLAAKALGIDTWDVHWHRLLAEPLDSGRWYQVTRRCDAAKIQAIVDLAVRVLPLEQIASGPDRQLGIGREYGPHQCLDAILQELDRFPGTGGALVLAAVRSPVIRNRNFALRVLAGWGEAAWPPQARERLLAAAAAEPDDKVRRRIADVIEGRPLEK